MLKDRFLRWLEALGDTLLGAEPPCLHCGRALEGARARAFHLCRSCLDRVALVRPPTCRRCGKPRPAGAGDVCGDCRARPVPFAASFAAAVYDGLWKELVGQLKFGGRRELAVPLGMAMAEVAWRAGLPERVHALVPVPLHPARLARRGYNQAAELAGVVAQQTGIPVLEALVRSRRGADAGPQSRRSARERRRSLRGAFIAWKPEALRGLSVAVVDDVYTTGATMDEASRALLRAGARQVFGLVAAVGVSDADLASGAAGGEG